METLFQDINYGIRILLKNRGFTLVAVISLALGIGANAAIFTLVNAVLLKNLPVTDPAALDPEHFGSQISAPQQLQRMRGMVVVVESRLYSVD